MQTIQQTSPANPEVGLLHQYRFVRAIHSEGHPWIELELSNTDGTSVRQEYLTVDDAAALIRALRHGVDRLTGCEVTREPRQLPLENCLLHGRNIGKRWEGADESLLVALYLDGRPSSEIAPILGRTPGAVIARLEGLGLFGLSTPRPDVQVGLPG